MRTRSLAFALGISIGLAAAAAPPEFRKHTASFVARAYCLRGRTADGSRPARGIVAADTRVFPLGTRVRISGAGPYSGEYTVRDTGKSIRGNRLDVFIPTRQEALRFGVRRVVVTALKALPSPPAVREALLIEPPGTDVLPPGGPSPVVPGF